MLLVGMPHQPLAGVMAVDFNRMHGMALMQVIGLAILVVIFMYSAQLSLVVLAAVLLYALFRLAVYHKVRHITEQKILADSKEQSNFIETVRAIQTIKLFGAEVKREGGWQNLNVEATNKDMQLGVFNISFQTCNRLLFGLENILVVYLGAKLVLAGGFSTGMLFAFIAYKSQFMDRMARLIEKAIQFRMLNRGKGPAVGLFAGQEIRLIRGPLFVDHPYELEREIIAANFEIAERARHGCIRCRATGLSGSGRRSGTAAGCRSACRRRWRPSRSQASRSRTCERTSR